jgi:lactate dehydrogenase-like 2-hydroxyacid dehydrogenase
MKPGAIIINTAWGKIINKEAMIRTLEDGHVCCWSWMAIAIN